MPSIALPVSLRGQLLSGFRFSPLSLFTASEPGLWYDPSDLTTLFQDTAGATPVTAPGQTVARINDKSGRGNNATQATAASRPTYGIVPLGGRRNIYTFTEQFGNADWSKTNTTIAADVEVAPNGTTTADKLQENAGAAVYFSVGRNPSGTVSTAYTWSCYAKAAERSFLSVNFSVVGVIASINLTTGATQLNAGTATLQSTNVGSGWWRFSIAFTTAASGANPLFHIITTDTAIGVPTVVGTAGFGFYLWGAQVELGSTATAYQRVGTAFDVTEAGVQSLSYLSFDGVDDFLVTPTITPGIDKVQVFAGVRKLTDAANTIVESSLTSASNFGTFRLWGVSGGGFGFRSRGPSGTSPGDATVGTPLAPTTQVASGIGDLSTDTSLLRLNGVQVASNSTDQGAGDYSAYPIYIGRRGGTLEPLSGNIYGLIVRFGSNLAAGAITSTETFVNEKTGAY